MACSRKTAQIKVYVPACLQSEKKSIRLFFSPCRTKKEEDVMTMIFKRLFSMAVPAVLLVLLTSTGLGQEYRGRIQGNVLDSSQAAIVGATVNLLNLKTNMAAVRLTNDAGRYLFDLVEPGTYKFTVQVNGFNKFEQDNIVVPSRADLTINAVLKPGDISETVSVSAETATLQFNTSKMESNVNQKLVESLPQMYRNVFLFAQLDPSVQSTSWGEDNPYDTWASNNLKVGGS